MRQMFNGRYLIKLLPNDDKSEGGIILPKEYAGFSNLAKVLEVPIDAKLPIVKGETIGIENHNLCEVDRFNTDIMIILERDICFKEAVSE